MRTTNAKKKKTSKTSKLNRTIQPKARRARKAKRDRAAPKGHRATARDSHMPVRTFPWQASTTWACPVAGKGTHLGLFVTGAGGSYMAAALAAPSGLPTAQSFLDHHAHHIIGEFDDLESAMTAAEEYGIEWRKTSAMPPECPCEEIGASPPFTAQTIDAAAMEAAAAAATPVHNLRAYDPVVGPDGQMVVRPLSIVVIDVDGVYSIEDLHRARVAIDRSGRVLKNAYGRQTAADVEAIFGEGAIQARLAVDEMERKTTAEHGDIPDDGAL